MAVRTKRERLPNKIPIDMTPMIDIVFQLLTFFVMTLQVASLEGDFDIKMPLAKPSGQPPTTQLLPMTLRLSTDANGELSALELNGQPFSGPQRFERLHNHLASVLDDGNLASTAEVTLDCDYGLKYEYVVQAITAVAGSVESDGQITKLVEKIKFAPPRTGS